MKRKNTVPQLSAVGIILSSFVLSESFFILCCGNPSNFEDNHPINLLGTIYKGGVIVPIILTLFLTVVILSVERILTFFQIKGKGNIADFMEEGSSFLTQRDYEKVEILCAKQKGLIADIITSGFETYREIETLPIDKEAKLEKIKSSIESEIALQLPLWQQNLSIIAVISNLGTLIGLFGTVLGMIKSFHALGALGAVDSVTLSIGISEALINTAMGIATAILAIISYSYFDHRIDQLTTFLDQFKVTLTQIYAETHPD